MPRAAKEFSSKLHHIKIQGNKVCVLKGPDHVQMTKVNWKLKVNWNDVAQKYKNILQFTLLLVNHVI